jgi:hypothetical protein
MIQTNNPAISGLYFIGADGNLIVNIKNTCFLMTPRGGYVIWKQTMGHGALMPAAEWNRLLVCCKAVPKDLPPSLLKKAVAIREGLMKNRFYGMTTEQIKTAEQNRQDFMDAKAQGIDLAEFRHRKEVQAKRQEKRLLKTPIGRTFEPTKTNDGRTHFLLGNVPGFKSLYHSM